MITLAHMSDIHLAPLPPVKWTELVNKRITGYVNWRLRRQATLAGDGLTNLVRHMKDQAPDFVAVTGDLVNLGLEPEAKLIRGRPGRFEVARSGSKVHLLQLDAAGVGLPARVGQEELPLD